MHKILGRGVREALSRKIPTNKTQISALQQHCARCCFAYRHLEYRRFETVALWYSRRFERRYSDTVGVLKIDVLSVDNLIVGLMNIDVMEERLIYSYYSSSLKLVLGIFQIAIQIGGGGGANM